MRRSSHRISWCAGLLALLCILTGSGCSVSGLELVRDKRVRFLEPKPFQLVTLPIRFKWTISDFKVEGSSASVPSRQAGNFALFIDRPPIGPGQTLRALASRSCAAQPSCFNASYLAERGVYATTAPSYTLGQIANVNSYQKVQVHELTVVLMDSAGRRIGESAWYLDFRMNRLGG